MTAKKETRKTRIQQRMQKIVSAGKTKIEVLEILTLMLRAYDSAKSLAEAYSIEIRKILREIMRELGIKEHIVKRTIVKMIYQYNFPRNEDKAKEAYEKLIDIYGEEKVGDWIEVGSETITKTFYRFREEAIQEIQKSGEEERIINILGATPRIEVGPIPKRAKRGEPLIRKKKTSAG